MKYFPKLMFALDKSNSVNSTTGTTLLHSRSFNVTPIKNSFAFGDEFIATISSMDSKGTLKTFGGDFYRARLIRRGGRNISDGIPCRLNDNEDGTYDVKAPLLLEGLLELEVKLVICFEGIRELLKQTKGLSYWGIHFIATLENGENTTCNMNFSYFPK